MLWKHTLGKPGDTYIIGKHWVKKHIPNTKRIAKTLHNESCPGAIYDIGFHYLPDDPSKRHHLWLCIESGKLFDKSPSLKVQPKSKSKKIKPKPVTKKRPIKAKDKIKPIVKKPPEPELEPVKPTVPAKPTINTLTSVLEVKGIGKTVYKKLAAANIKTIGDLLSKHSQEIATLIGRKSDKQIKSWQENAQKMLSG